LYFRYTDPGRKQRAIPLGLYDRTGRAGLTLAQARDKARELSKLYQGGEREVREYLEEERRAELARKKTEDRERKRLEAEAGRGTLKALLEAYADHLDRLGRESARQARQLFERNVFTTWPSLASKKAAEVRPTDITTVLRGVIERGHGRTAAKLRAYIRAAYSLALKSEHDATAPAVLRTFGIESNPAAATAALSAFNRARDRTLNAPELRAYLLALQNLDASPARAALKISLFLGGQRPAQVLRAAPGDVDVPGRAITIRDGKGARRQPRLHLLPLTDRAFEEFSSLLISDDARDWVFSSDGRRATRPETLSGIVRHISAAMANDPELKRTRAWQGPFELRDIRRTCETMLAAIGISREVRAQLQSHGLGGVQQRHYDRHDYWNEKVLALQAWDAHLERLRKGRGLTAQIVPIARTQAGKQK
jgi:hypothetical protein